MLRCLFCAIPVVGMALLIDGCQSAPASNPPKPNETTVLKGPRSSLGGAGGNSKDYFDVDSCADRLHTIEGQIIIYYARFHRLPNSLEELRPFADPGENIDYICPVSHQSYVYVANGLVLGSDPQRLIVYDATPAHGGIRWGILFSLPKGRQPLTTHVIPIPESSMKGFVPAPPIAEPLPPATMPVRPGQQ